MPTTMAENLARIQQAIEHSCRAAGRSSSDVKLMAVSKTHPVDSILEAVGLGLRHFGESKVQEFTSKAAALPADIRSQIEVRMIGNLQSNKAGKAAGLFDGIDTLDSWKLAVKLNDVAGAAGKRLPVLLEIKLSLEENKAGLSPGSPELAMLLERIPDLPSIEVQGLMTIAPLNVSSAETRACFRSLRVLRDEFSQAHPSLRLTELSMGMSTDFPLAIAEGATRIRIGTALFGARDYSA